MRRWRYPFLFAMATLAGLAATLALFVLMERDRLGSYTLDRPPAPARAARRPVAGIVDVHLRRQLGDARVARIVASWTAFVGGVGADVRHLSASDPEGIAGIGAVDVVVVPGPVGLAPAELHAIEAALVAGKSLLVATGGGMGAGDALAFRAPLWRALLAEAPAVRALPTPTFLVVGRDVPFRGDLPRGAGVRVDGALLDAPGLPIRWGHVGAGRWVLFGFDPAAVASESRDRATMSALLGGAFAWLGGGPAVEVLPWPAGRPAALLVTVASDGRPVPADLAVPWTLTYAPVGPGTGAAALPATVDLATRGDGAPCGRPREDQARIVAAAADAARRAWPERTPRGYAPPGDRVDGDTLAVLADAGFEYVLAAGDTLQPDLVGARLVRLPRTADDDLGYALRTGDADPAALLRARRADLERVVAAGGLFTLALDGATLERPGAADALGELLDDARRHDAWTASAGDIAAWWRRRSGVLATVASPTPHRVVLRLSNVGDAAVEDVAVRVHLPEPASRVDMELAHWRRTSGADYRVEHAPGSDALVVIANLPAGANEVLHLEWP